MKGIESADKCQKSKIACILNYPSHYRENIFLKMEDCLDCDFYFGDIEEGKIKKIDYSFFNKNISNLNTKALIHNFNWITGTIPLLFNKNYHKYVLTGDPFIVSNWFFLILNIATRKEVFLWGHGWYGREGRIKKILKRTFFKMADGVFLYGNYAKKLMESVGFDKQKLHVIYNSLDYEAQLKIRRTLKPSKVFQDYFKNNNPVLIFTGRLTKVKKIDLLIEAHELLYQKGIKLNVLILGNGSEKERLEKAVNSKGLTKYYWFYGECYDEEKIGAFYFNARVCISPGNVGLTAIHSMSYGCPVITHDNFTRQMPEFETIEPNKTGMFFKENNVDDLARCIEEFTKNTISGEEVRENCFGIVDEYYNPNYQIKLFNKVLSR